jgi:hypothetical protein
VGDGNDDAAAEANALEVAAADERPTPRTSAACSTVRARGWLVLMST